MPELGWRQPSDHDDRLIHAVWYLGSQQLGAAGGGRCPGWHLETDDSVPSCLPRVDQRGEAGGGLGGAVHDHDVGHRLTIRPSRGSSLARVLGYVGQNLLGLTERSGGDAVHPVARRHRVGRSSARFVIVNASPTGTTTSTGSPGWRWVGADERGRQLELIAVEVQGDRDPEPVLLVVHVMPTHHREEPS